MLGVRGWCSRVVYAAVSYGGVVVRTCSLM